MKTKVLFIMLVGLSFMQVAFNQEEAKEATVKIKTSAHCDACKNKIEYALAYEKGVKTCVVDMETKEATVTYKTDKTNPEKIILAIKKLGYEATTKKEEVHKHSSSCGSK